MERNSGQALETTAGTAARIVANAKLIDAEASKLIYRATNIEATIRNDQPVTLHDAEHLVECSRHVLEVSFRGLRHVLETVRADAVADSLEWWAIERMIDAYRTAFAEAHSLNERVSAIMRHRIERRSGRALGDEIDRQFAERPIPYDLAPDPTRDDTTAEPYQDGRESE